MPKIKQIVLRLATSTPFWLLVMVAILAAIVWRYEKPMDFGVDSSYTLFR